MRPPKGDQMTKFEFTLGFNVRAYGSLTVEADAIEQAIAGINPDTVASHVNPGDIDWNNPSSITIIGVVSDGLDVDHIVGTEVADEEPLEVSSQSTERPEKFRDKPSFSPLEMEAALCAWEWMLESRDKEPLDSHFKGLGYAAMRHCSIQAGSIALAVYEEMEQQDYEFEDAYDWEFVPSVICRLDWAALTEDNQYNGAPYWPDIPALLAGFLAANPTSFTKRDRNAEWRAKAKAECQKQWAYPGLLDDHAERSSQACANGEDPAEFVKWLGEKYDLIPAHRW